MVFNVIINGFVRFFVILGEKLVVMEFKESQIVLCRELKETIAMLLVCLYVDLPKF